MAVEELFGQSRSGRRTELQYRITGETDAADSAAARAAMLAHAPTVFNGHPRDGLNAEVEELGPFAFIGRVPFTPNELKPPGNLPVDGQQQGFDIGTETVRITQSEYRGFGTGTVAAYDASGALSASPFGGAIGVSRDGVEGVDIVVPTYHQPYTRIFPNSAITAQYRGDLYHLVGRINDAPFDIFDTHEALLLGVTGRQRTADSDSDWELVFKVAGSPNATGLEVGDITGVAKDGWDHLWAYYVPKDVEYQDSQSESKKFTIMVPDIAVVERVYPRGDFGLLGLD